MSQLFTWKLHGDGTKITPGEIVPPNERLLWPITFGVGAQHMVAMFGATFLVPLLTGFDPATTLFFTGVGTILLSSSRPAACRPTWDPRSRSSLRLAP